MTTTYEIASHDRSETYEVVADDGLAALYEWAASGCRERADVPPVAEWPGCDLEAATGYHVDGDATIERVDEHGLVAVVDGDGSTETITISVRAVTT